MGSMKANIECLKQWMTTLKTKKKEETRKPERHVKSKGFHKR
jgi:hypothetical protein